ncbi:MAG: ribosomal protein S18-alanine N-acetyltransferase [Candidatus Aminicenantes bacterium]|nr:ribosomal protein S18-alanine N-acetyltransferase [Candidatus Aminicenantes bacterium]MCK5004390.1 ribosomal protein S18-alanine N-acetyltransferase [Candidatus Aminicenantes bacterium]
MRKKISAPGKIEPATPDDLDHILDIERESSPNPWKRSFFEDELTGRLSTILVFKGLKEEGIKGFIIFRKIDDIVEINNIAVCIPERRKGVAASLLSFLKTFAIKESVIEIFLEVRSQNTGAVKLYEKFGFRFSGIRKGYYSNPKDDALMFKIDIN